MFVLFSTKPKAINHDDLTFKQVFDDYYDYVLRLALNLSGNLADAEDITQEVFIGVNNGLTRFQGKSQLKTWIYRITIRIACRYLSKVKSMDNIDDLKAGATGKAQQPNRAETDVLAIMRKLPLEQRTLISLSAIKGLSHQQIASILNLPAGTIGSRLHTARKNLSQLISQHT